METINSSHLPCTLLPVLTLHNQFKSGLYSDNMLDINDFIAERGGDPDKIKESQRRRYAPESAVDEVIALYEEARKSMCTELLTRLRPN